MGRECLQAFTFDTETTGLDPQGGDEIISIGAVRIVNNRILHDESFDQLVDPRRPIPQESNRIHGISPEMVAGQPTIAKALQSFSQFTENTILVAHNAAFDMRMLQLKEDISGIRFSNPVLDTMLLSAVVQPGQTNHDMEGIAARLGISIVGRHTALGNRFHRDHELPSEIRKSLLGDRHEHREPPSLERGQLRWSWPRRPGSLQRQRPV